VSITNETGDDDGMKFNRFLASLILSKTEKRIYEFPALFQHELFQPALEQGIKLIKGELGLQNGFAFWSGKFTFLGKFTIMLLPMVAKEGEFNLAILEFPGHQERVTFCKINNLDLLEVGEMASRKSNVAEEYYFGYNNNCIIVLESFLSKEFTGKYIQAIEEFISR